MIYFARHGETDANKQKLFNGEIDLDLNDAGVKQVQAQAEKLSGVKFDKVFCSPKMRAIQTCKIIIKNGEYVIDDRLTELNCGKFDGKKRNPVSNIQFGLSLKKGKNGVERLDKFTARNVDFCEKVLEPLKGKNILVVSHHGNAVAFDYFFRGKPKGYNFGKRIVGNGGILTFDF